MYQVLFSITYNNKIFTIFNTDNNRKTFLELNTKGQYIYPTIKDFIELHNIYNSNREVLYMNNKDKIEIYTKARLHPKTRVTFKEKVRTLLGLVAIEVLAINIGLSLVNKEFKLTIEDNTPKITIEIKDEAFIKDIKELDNILGYDYVAKEVVIQSINDNKNIPESYKENAIQLLEFITNKYPNTDMRIYYENIKRMNIIESEIDHEFIAGSFASSTGEITIYKNYTHHNGVKTRELAHSYHSWHSGTLFYPIHRIEDYGFSLNEAYTNKITSGITSTGNTYNIQGRVLDYFLSCVPYTYYDYEQYGIIKLITMLEEKYPSIDINYLITSIDSITDTSYTTKNILALEENTPLLDTFFEICISNIDTNSKDLYKPLYNFFKLIDYNTYSDLTNKYFLNYNKALIQKGISKEVLLKNEQVLIDKLNLNKAIKIDFKEYLTYIDINSITSNNLYDMFRKYQSPYKQHTIEDILDILDIYNDYLYCHGFNSNQTIKREDIEDKVKYYQYLQGYYVYDGKIYPIISSKNLTDEQDNNFYQCEVLNQEGQIEKIILPSYTYKYSIYYSGTRLLELFDKYELNSEEFFQEYYSLSPLDYKKVPIYNNKEFITNKVIKDISIRFCKTIDNKIGFSLYYLDNDVLKKLYESPNIIEQSNISTDLSYYISFLDNYTDRTSLELNEILNQEYLKQVIINTSKPNCSSSIYSYLFYNQITDNIEFHPDYFIHYKIDEQYKDISLNSFYWEYNKLYLFDNIISEDIYLDVDIYERKIYLEEVLRYYELLNLEQSTYELTKEDIINLYKSYLGLSNEKQYSKTLTPK